MAVELLEAGFELFYGKQQLRPWGDSLVKYLKRKILEEGEH